VRHVREGSVFWPVMTPGTRYPGPGSATKTDCSSSRPPTSPSAMSWSGRCARPASD